MSRMRVAVVGGGISGLAAAYVLAKDGAEVVVYEKEDALGGRAKTVDIGGTLLDLGFTVFSRVMHPETTELLDSLGVDRELCDMSFSVSLDEGQGCEWGTRNGISSLFAQKANVLNPYFWNMIREIVKFKNDASSYVEELENNPDIDRNETLEHFIQSRGYSELFQKAFLVPTCASIWSCSSGVMNFSAYSVLSVLRNDPTLQLIGGSQRLTPRWRSESYVDKVKKELESRGCQIRTNSEIYSIFANERDGSEEVYDGCIIATPAPDALKMLGKHATHDELRILGAFQYACSDAFLHHDNDLMPKNRAVWSSRNFLGTTDKKAYITYLLNNTQHPSSAVTSVNYRDSIAGDATNINDTVLPFFFTLNPPHTPKSTLFKWSTRHLIPSVAASKALRQLNLIQGKRRLWFYGAYQGALEILISISSSPYVEYLIVCDELNDIPCVTFLQAMAFPEDGIKAGISAANDLLRKSYTVQYNRKHTVPSWLEIGARGLVTRFFERFVATGCIILLEEGGTAFTFEGTRGKSNLKVTLRVHTPQFYWKVATEADVGFADAYIHGDFSLIDIRMRAFSTLSWGWWTPLLYTSIVSSAKYFFKHVARQNTLTQARRNISQHYDLSNEFFSLFLDETMTYSCAMFKTPDEDLMTAQLRKTHTLIEKARISKEHHILEIGCGWGSLALEVVKRTGCKYTGITLSEKQLQYAELKVKEAGLQDRIEFLLCDYRQLPKSYKYDRIISCGMIEHVGHEVMQEFFRFCESALAENGLLVLQFIAIADEKYDESRRSAGFIKEYIFPGGCVPSLSHVISCMAAASRFSAVHLEEIGCHYFHTLRRWRENLLKNQSKILAMGFNEKFIRTWEYYFNYCAAGFKYCFLGDYQSRLMIVVFVLCILGRSYSVDRVMSQHLAINHTTLCLVIIENVLRSELAAASNKYHGSYLIWFHNLISLLCC
ncbi:putative fatty acid methyltransferase [Sesamum angolense]|uniref:Fatty acid methyltransferase n=1 Tax=Sesamum angolense TaxID=2727404 RepID=A0AAE1X5W8_9LAMI|nr:putative fatty acid methyltransferase [Sesamum angolense]